MHETSQNKKKNNPVLEGWKAVATVGKPHGLQGAFFVGGRTSVWPEHFESLLIGSDFSTQVLSHKLIQKRSVLTVSGITSRTRVEALQGALICIPSDEKEHELSDFVGKNVVDSQGKVLGHISEFYNFGAGDTVEITCEEKTLLVPFIDKYFAETDESADSVQMIVDSEIFSEFWD